MTHLLNVEDAEEEEEKKLRKCGTHVRIKYFQLYIKKHTHKFVYALFDQIGTTLVSGVFLFEFQLKYDIRQLII